MLSPLPTSSLAPEETPRSWHEGSGNTVANETQSLPSKPHPDKSAPPNRNLYHRNTPEKRVPTHTQKAPPRAAACRTQTQAHLRAIGGIHSHENIPIHTQKPRVVHCWAHTNSRIQPIGRVCPVKRTPRPVGDRGARDAHRITAPERPSRKERRPLPLTIQE